MCVFVFGNCAVRMNLKSTLITKQKATTVQNSNPVLIKVFL